MSSAQRDPRSCNPAPNVYGGVRPCSTHRSIHRIQCRSTHSINSLELAVSSISTHVNTGWIQGPVGERHRLEVLSILPLLCDVVKVSLRWERYFFGSAVARMCPRNLLRGKHPILRQHVHRSTSFESGPNGCGEPFYRHHARDRFLNIKIQSRLLPTHHSFPQGSRRAGIAS